MSVGLGALVALTRADDGISDYYLHGFSRLTRDVQVHCVLASISATPAEAVQDILMEDDRLLRHIDSMETALEHEVRQVQSIPLYVLRRLSETIGDISVETLREHLYHSTLRTAAFVYRKCVQPYKELPYPVRFAAATAPGVCPFARGAHSR